MLFSIYSNLISHIFSRKSYIRLRLHGTRLPKNYTVILRLPSTYNNYASKQQSAPSGLKNKRRRVDPDSLTIKPKPAVTPASTDSEHEFEAGSPEAMNATAASAAIAMSEGEGEAEEEYARIRQDNAYPGATNSIGSVHQRQWYLMLDQANSGLVRDRSPSRNKGYWKRGIAGEGFEAFFVRGPEYERSVVTGRLSEEVMADEGVDGFVARKMWRPILE